MLRGMDELVTTSHASLSQPAAAVDPRTDQQAAALSDAAADLAAVLPTRVEAAVVRALADGPAPRQLADLHHAVAVVAEALQAERLGRLGDIELLVDLVSADADAIRTRIAQLDERVSRLADSLDGLVSAIEQLTPVVTGVSEKLDRRVRISVHTEPGAQPFAAPASGEP
jgi:hypothetical protein